MARLRVPVLRVRERDELERDEPEREADREAPVDLEPLPDLELLLDRDRVAERRLRVVLAR